MNVIAETKTKEAKKILEDILGKKILSRKREKKEILETLLWIFNCSYNTTITFLYIIPYGPPSKYEKLFSMVGPNFVKEWKYSPHQEQNYLYPSFHVTLYIY